MIGSGPFAVLLDDWLTGAMAPERVAELGLDGPRNPDIAWQDQTLATQRDAIVMAQRRVGVAAVASPAVDVPEWIRLGALSTIAALACGEATTCGHVHIDSPQPLYSAAWKPGVVTCSRLGCLLLLEVDGGPGSDADRTCDGCGAVVDRIHANEVVVGGLAWRYGTCRSCRRDERLDRPTTADLKAAVEMASRAVALAVEALAAAPGRQARARLREARKRLAGAQARLAAVVPS